MDFSGMMSELQGVRKLMSRFVVVLLLFGHCSNTYTWIEGDDGCVK